MTVNVALAEGGSLHALSSRRSFLVYQLVWLADKGKWNKVPVLPTDAMDFAHLLTADQAIAAAAQRGKGYGVGFVLQADDPFFLLDVDNAFVEGKWSDVAVELYHQFHDVAYEVSTSGTGMHLIGAYSQPFAHRCKNTALGLELYTRDRFVALTGAGCRGAAEVLADDRLVALVAKYFPPREYGDLEVDETVDQAVPEWSGPADDDALIERMLASRAGAHAVFGGGATVQTLWAGDTSHFGGDLSSCDQALVNHLAFWTGKNPARMVRLWERSELWREKAADRPDYRASTLANAIAGCARVYGQRDPQRPVEWTDAVAANYRGPMDPVTIIDNIQRGAQGEAWAKGDVATMIQAAAWRSGGSCDLAAQVLATAGVVVPAEQVALAVASQTSFAHVDDRPAGGMTAKVRDAASVFEPGHFRIKEDRVTGVQFVADIKPTRENLTRMLRYYGLWFRYNEMTHAAELWTSTGPLTGETAANDVFSDVRNLCVINDYPTDMLGVHFDRMAKEDSYHPALEWVMSTPWDGVPRVGDLFNCLTLKDEAHRADAWVLFRKWLLGSVALLARRTEEFAHVLVLVDEGGGTGKTRFFNTLCPPDCRTDGVTLDPKDKDSVLAATGKWLAELGELDSTFRRSDIAQLKAFLSKREDTMRPAYARASNTYQRRTAFMGTVNNLDFLADDTNNRRFWPIHVVGVNYQHRIDMQQVWAECLACVDAGEAYWLDKDQNAAIGSYTGQFRSLTSLEERVLQCYDPSAIRTRWLSATEVLNDLGMISGGRSESTVCGKILRRLNFDRKIKDGYPKYHLPERKIQ